MSTFFTLSVLTSVCSSVCILFCLLPFCLYVLMTTFSVSAFVCLSVCILFCLLPFVCLAVCLLSTLDCLSTLYVPLCHNDMFVENTQNKALNNKVFIQNSARVVIEKMPKFENYQCVLNCQCIQTSKETVEIQSILMCNIWIYPWKKKTDVDL